MINWKLEVLNPAALVTWHDTTAECKIKRHEGVKGSPLERHAILDVTLIRYRNSCWEVFETGSYVCHMISSQVSKKFPRPALVGNEGGVAEQRCRFQINNRLKYVIFKNIHENFDHLATVLLSASRTAARLRHSAFRRRWVTVRKALKGTPSTSCSHIRVRCENAKSFLHLLSVVRTRENKHSPEKIVSGPFSLKRDE